MHLAVYVSILSWDRGEGFPLPLWKNLLPLIDRQKVCAFYHKHFCSWEYVNQKVFFQFDIFDIKIRKGEKSYFIENIYLFNLS